MTAEGMAESGRERKAEAATCQCLGCGCTVEEPCRKGSMEECCLNLVTGFCDSVGCRHEYERFLKRLTRRQREEIEARVAPIRSRVLEQRKQAIEKRQGTARRRMRGKVKGKAA